MRRSVDEKLDEVLLRLGRIELHLYRERVFIMSALDDLATQVKANTSAEASAIELIQGLAAQLAAAGTDPAKLQALQSELAASAASLGAAIVANTPPPAPAPAPSPAPAPTT